VTRALPVLLALLERVPVRVGCLPSGVLVVGDYLLVADAPGLGDLDGGGEWEVVSFLLPSGLGLTLEAGGLAVSLSGDFALSS
jgi:hypothetical protein